MDFDILIGHEIEFFYNQLAAFYESLRNSSASVSGRQRVLEILSDFREKFTKLSVLYNLPLTDVIALVHEKIDKQDREIENCANELFLIHNNLKSSQLPLLDLYSAVDVLGTGSYRQLPTIIKDHFGSKLVSSKHQQDSALQNLESLIHIRLLCNEILPKQFMENRIIKNGCVYFSVPGEFSVALTLFLQGNLAVWQIKELKFDFDAFDRKTKLLDERRINAIIIEAQNQLDHGEGNYLLYNLFKQLHNIFLNFQLQILSLQADQLRKRWKTIRSVFTDNSLKINIWSAGSAESTSSDCAYVLEIFEFDAEKDRQKDIDSSSHFVAVIGQMKYIGLNMRLLKNNVAVPEFSNIPVPSSDLENILAQVTDRLSENIVKGWYKHLLAKKIGASLVEAQLLENSRLYFLEIEIGYSQKLVLKMNPRSGYISLELPDNFDGGKDFIIAPAIRILQDMINENNDTIEYACKMMDVAVKLKSVQVLAAQLNLKVISAPPAPKPLVEELLKLYLKTESLGEYSICVAAQGEPASVLQVFLTHPGEENFRRIDIKPVHIHEARFGSSPPKESDWEFLTQIDICKICRFSSLYLAFNQACQLLDTYPLFYQFVVPSSTSVPTKNALISNNPCLCVRVVKNKKIQLSRLGRAELYPNPVFFRISSGPELIALENQKIRYTVHIPIPSDCLPFFSEYQCDLNANEGTNSDKYDFNSRSIQLDYSSFNEIQAQMLKDTTAILEILDNARTIFGSCPVGFEIQIPDAKSLTLRLSPEIFVKLNYAHEPNTDGFLSLDSCLSPDVSAKLISHLNLLYTEGKFLVPPMLQNLSIYMNFLTDVDSLTKSVYGGMDMKVKMDLVEILSVKIAFGDNAFNFGFKFTFLHHYILLEDCSICDSSVFTPLPYYEDITIQSVNSPGILTILNRICNAKVNFGHRIIFPSACLPEITYFLQSYIEVVCCVLKLHENVPPNAAFEIASLRIMIPSAHTQFVFAGSLDKAMMAHKNKDKGFSQIAAFVLEKVHLLHPCQRETFTWCKFLMELSGLKELVVKDIIKLVELFGKDDKQASEASWLIKVPEDLPSSFASPGSTALYIKDNHLHFLFHFKDERDQVLLPLKRDLIDGGISWWETNPYKTGMQMLEGVAFPKSKTEQFPGVASLITSLKRCSVSKIKS